MRVSGFQILFQFLKKKKPLRKTKNMNNSSIWGLAIAFLTLVFVLYQTPEKPAAIPEPGDAAAARYGSPLIDGQSADPAWQLAEWRPLDQVWIGQPPAAADCSGRYKLLWDENNLYVLAEITDDTLVDTHADPLLKYWDDDCLEIFIDEDASGGNHQYNYNAFAYHIALDGKVADIGPDEKPHLYDDHCTTRRSQNGKLTTWEVAMRIYDGKRYTDGGENIPKTLKAGKLMGFALAYCDNDHSPERENFLGSELVEGEDKNRGWIDAGIFGKLRLAN
jgi:hypothetical protein